MIAIDVDETPGLVETADEVVIARGRVQTALSSAVEPAPLRVPGSWRTLPGWESFRYDPTLLAPLDDPEIEAEGWM